LGGPGRGAGGALRNSAPPQINIVGGRVETNSIKTASVKTMKNLSLKIKKDNENK
jgi:hypothetical protein